MFRFSHISQYTVSYDHKIIIMYSSQVKALIDFNGNVRYYFVNQNPSKSIATQHNSYTYYIFSFRHCTLYTVHCVLHFYFLKRKEKKRGNLRLIIFSCFLTLFNNHFHDIYFSFQQFPFFSLFCLYIIRFFSFFEQKEVFVTSTLYLLNFFFAFKHQKIENESGS